MVNTRWFFLVSSTGLEPTNLLCVSPACLPDLDSTLYTYKGLNRVMFFPWLYSSPLPLIHPHGLASFVILLLLALDCITTTSFLTSSPYTISNISQNLLAGVLVQEPIMTRKRPACAVVPDRPDAKRIKNGAEDRSNFSSYSVPHAATAGPASAVTKREPSHRGYDRKPLVPVHFFIFAHLPTP